MQCENESYTSTDHKKTNLWEKKENTLNDKQYAQRIWSNKM